MPRRQELYSWTDTVTTTFAHLSKPQAAVLALWSFGIVLTRSCALSAVARRLARLLTSSSHALRQRLREWYLAAGAKGGARRRQVEVATCFAPLLRWLVADWPHRQLALAFDPTTPDTRFVSLTVGVVCRGTAVPVAWRVVPATARKSWNAGWLTLLGHLRDALPAGWLVLVLTDRGLWAEELFDAVRALGWHPVMRVSRGGSFRPHGWHHFRAFGRLLRHPGACVRVGGTAFATPGRGVACTLWGWREQGHAEPWLLLTDLAPEQGDARRYALRAWIEQLFKDLKSGGLQWQRTRMAAPDRVERLWLALALAQAWQVRVGSASEDREQAEREAPPPRPRRHEPRRRVARPRREAVASRGHEEILVALLRGRKLPLGRLTPQPWPAIPVPRGPTEAGAGALEVA